MTTTAGPTPTALVGPATGTQHLPPERVELVRNALVMPMRDRATMACGVFRANGTFCTQSRTLISSNRFTGIPTAAKLETVQTVEGRFLYAGIGRHHFGHFLLESISRLWAMEDERANVDGILVIPMHGMDIESVLRRRFLPFYRILGYDRPLYLVQEPVQIPQLLVPSQAFGHSTWIAGTERFRQFTRQRLASALSPDGPEKLYISRSALKHPDQSIDQEDRIEALMQEAGYTIFHPQNHSVRNQCEHYMAARCIVGGDGSAFHLVPFLMQSGTRIGLIRRRTRRSAFTAFVEQIKAFDDVRLTTFDALEPAGLPAKTGARSAREKPKLDFDRLRHDLGQAGFL